VVDAATLTWRRTATSLALVRGANVLWQAVADPAQGKPYFHPLATPGGVVVSDLRPADHLWHRGLWWSWKLINGLTDHDSSEPAKNLPLPGETFALAGHAAFLIPSNKAVGETAKPWVWYAPTLPGLPGPDEKWMFEQFLAAGIAVAGIDVDESYGSPAGRKLFTALYDELTATRGYSHRPVLLGRSRGGLMTLSWMADNPDKVAAFAGIYPVCNLASYPGVSKAAGAYAMQPEELQAKLAQHNPIDRLAGLAKAGIPLFAIHGDGDLTVPLEANSGFLKERYAALGGTMEIVVAHGQGHNMWSGFFQNEALVNFVKHHAK
jgi:pimeloyl-ACP methyl ester carboxylesterase